MVSYQSLIRRSRRLPAEAGDHRPVATFELRLTARRIAGYVLAVLIFLASAAHGQAQGLVAVDDVFSVPFGEDLVVEAPGVLSNDTFNGDPAEDHSATAELVGDVSYGYLSCDSDPFYELCPEGSFIYTP